jgi:hypothetical protein
MLTYTYRYCHNEAAKARWAATYRRQLRKVAHALGLVKGQYDLRFNRGGPAVWGEVTLHTDTLYVQASASHPERVLVRTCRGREDYTGGRNHWLSQEVLLVDPAAFAAQASEVSVR